MKQNNQTITISPANDWFWNYSAAKLEDVIFQKFAKNQVLSLCKKLLHAKNSESVK